jgi:hypothetical protein
VYENFLFHVHDDHQSVYNIIQCTVHYVWNMDVDNDIWTINFSLHEAARDYEELHESASHRNKSL